VVALLVRLPKEFVREWTRMKKLVIPAQAGISVRSFWAQCRLRFGVSFQKIWFWKKKAGRCRV
jgi:hypothetical protein